MLPENRIKYLLGIDGGGTKTEFLLTDLNNNKIADIVLGSSNPVNSGIEKSESVLRLGIDEVCKDINLKEVSVFAGLAGSGSVDIKNEINKFLAEFSFGAYLNGSDTDNAIEASLKGKRGVVAIMGTGIVAFAQDDFTRHRIGGWGYMIDSGGSGFHYGADALNSAFGFLDGRGGSELILSLIENKLGKKIENALSDIYGGGASYVASFAPVVFDAFNQGDKLAEIIIERNSKEAASLINAAQKHVADKNYKTVICGGLSKQKDILMPFFMKYVENAESLVFSDERIVNGAISLARANIGGLYNA